jgi:hypothetical protein
VPGRIARLGFRLTGWVVTPLVVIVAAGIGATIGTVVAPLLGTNAGFALTLVLGFAGGIVGLSLWINLLRQRPHLREVLAVTPEGVPEDAVIEPPPTDPPQPPGAT